jgi:hypothetical protein
MDKWKSLSATAQQKLQSAVTTGLEAPAWESAQAALQNDIACLTGKGECGSGESRNMTLVEASPADIKMARDVLITEVLPDWAERAGGDWAERWNNSVGKVVGVEITQIGK